MAAIGIHAWHDASEHQNTAAAPDVEWYSRDEDYMMRRANGNRNRTIACATTQMASRSRVHTFVAFDKLGNRYRVGVDSYAEISMISKKAVKPSWDTIDLKGLQLSRCQV